MKKLGLLFLCYMSSLWCAEKTDFFADNEQFQEAIAITAVFHDVAKGLQKAKRIKTVTLHEFTKDAPIAERSTSAGFMCDPHKDNKGYSLVTIWGKSPIVSDIEYSQDASGTTFGAFDKELIQKLSIIEAYPGFPPTLQESLFLYPDCFYLIRSINGKKPTHKSWWSCATMDKKYALAGWTALKEKNDTSKKDIDDRKSNLLDGPEEWVEV